MIYHHLLYYTYPDSFNGAFFIPPCSDARRAYHIKLVAYTQKKPMKSQEYPMISHASPWACPWASQYKKASAGMVSVPVDGWFSGFIELGLSHDLVGGWVWNMNFMTFHILGIITDFHIFQRGRLVETTKHITHDFLKKRYFPYRTFPQVQVFPFGFQVCAGPPGLRGSGLPGRLFELQSWREHFWFMVWTCSKYLWLVGSWWFATQPGWSLFFTHLMTLLTMTMISLMASCDGWVWIWRIHIFQGGWNHQLDEYLFVS